MRLIDRIMKCLRMERETPDIRQRPAGEARSTAKPFEGATGTLVEYTQAGSDERIITNIFEPEELKKTTSRVKYTRSDGKFGLYINCDKEMEELLEGEVRKRLSLGRKRPSDMVVDELYVSLLEHFVLSNEEDGLYVIEKSSGGGALIMEYNPSWQGSYGIGKGGKKEIQFESQRGEKHQRRVLIFRWDDLDEMIKLGLIDAEEVIKGRYMFGPMMDVRVHEGRDLIAHIDRVRTERVRYLNLTFTIPLHYVYNLRKEDK